MNEFSIVDLHCDLLSYLEKDSLRTPFDSQPRCSLDHLIQGNVSHQTLAIFAHTQNGSVQAGQRQVESFKKLLKLKPRPSFIYSRSFALFHYTVERQKLLHLLTSSILGLMDLALIGIKHGQIHLRNIVPQQKK